MSSIGAQAPRVAASWSPRPPDRRNPRQYPLELVILGAPPAPADAPLRPRHAPSGHFRARRLTLSSLLQMGEQPDLSGRSKQGIVESIAIEVAGLADPDLGG